MEKGNLSQESKDLLLRDICARLPYGVKANSRDGKKIITITPIGIANFMSGAIDIIKPYLRPMSSMTEKEMTEYKKLSVLQPTNNGYDWHEVATIDALDWLLANHLDFMGLIDEGLAIDCTNLNVY